MTEIIAAKRDGGVLSDEQIAFFVAGYTSGAVPDYQASALLMAIYLRGMDTNETAALTASMAGSGRQLDLGDLRFAIDKHSTGGVGDKTSLVVVPILAAAGARVCKMSGRGLGHTGGTLDKLEAIDGFQIALSPDAMLAQVRAIGACLCGQTDDLAPADRKLYALRDATATVASLPLIVASILSKKLAGGAGAFLFDVKFGGGALMESLGDAKALANALLDGAAAHGRRGCALLSDMDEPLGRSVGNALEVAEAIRLLDPATASDGDPRLRELCLALSAEGLALAKGIGRDDARAEAEAALSSGAARDVFAKLIDAQGGDAKVVGDPTRLPAAPVTVTLTADRGGFVGGIDARAVGEIVVALGGGRASKTDTINVAVGLEILAPVGKSVGRGHALARIHARTETAAEAAQNRLRGAFTLQDTEPGERSLIAEVLRR